MKLVSYLVREMEHQCLLLRGMDANVSSKPFQIPAKSCSWSQLEYKIKNKNHVWHQLEGGAAAALARICSKSSNFFHWLGDTRKKDTDQWMFKETV